MGGPNLGIACCCCGMLQRHVEREKTALLRASCVVTHWRKSVCVCVGGNGNKETLSCCGSWEEEGGGGERGRDWDSPVGGRKITNWWEKSHQLAVVENNRLCSNSTTLIHLSLPCGWVTDLSDFEEAMTESSFLLRHPVPMNIHNKLTGDFFFSLFPSHPLSNPSHVLFGRLEVRA